MASDPIPGSFPLPDVSAAISPFLRPRNEVQRVRAQIHAHVSSVAKSINTPSSSSALSQSRAEKSLTGVRKAYVDAIREHEAALKEWKTIVNKVQPPPPPKPDKKLPPTTPTRTAFAFDDDDEDEDEGDGEWLASRDAVLYLRRRYAQLLVAKKYLEKVQDSALAAEEQNGGKVTAKSIQEIIYESATNAPIPPPPSATVNDTTSAEDMLLPLEKAVVSVYEDQLKEKAMLRGAKELISRRNQGGAGSSSAASKVRALRAVKATLEGWLDAQLKRAGEDAATPRKSRPSLDGQGPQKEIDVEVLISDIQSAYDAYVDSREALLVSIHKSQAESSSPHSPTKKAPPPLALQAATADRPSESMTSSRLALLPYVDRLISTSSASKSAHTLSSALVRSIATNSDSMSTTIDRLRGESRLLDEYHHPTETGGSNTSWVKQWKYAADGSRKETVESIKTDVKSAEGRLDDAEARLEKVKEALGGGEGGVLGGMDGKVDV